MSNHKDIVDVLREQARILNAATGCGEYLDEAADRIDELENSLAMIKNHCMIESPVGYAMSGTYQIASKALHGNRHTGVKEDDVKLSVDT